MDKSSCTVSLTPFVVEAFASQRSIYAYVESLYEQYKYKAYEAAKNSGFYDHVLFSEGSIERDVFCKRVLGLWELAIEDYDIRDKLLSIMKKGWPHLYHILEKKEGKEISLKAVVDRFAISNMDTDYFNSHLIFTYVFRDYFGYSLKKDELYSELERSYCERSNFYTKGIDFKGYKKFEFDSLEEKAKSNTIALKKRVFERYGEMCSFEDLYELSKDNEEFSIVDLLSFVFDTENLSISAMLDTHRFSNKDLNELFSLYYINNVNKNAQKAMQAFIPACFLKMTLKAYNEVKKFYFENNKETLYLNMQSLENNNFALIEENNLLRKKIAKLEAESKRKEKQYKKGIEKENVSLRKQVAELKNTLELEEEKNKELHALREFAYSQTENIEIETGQKVPNVKAIIVGGTSSWHQRLAGELPDTFRFYEGLKLGFDMKILDSMEYVFFYTDLMKHPVYEKIINYCRKNNVKIGYIANTEMEKVERAIAKIIYQ